MTTISDLVTAALRKIKVVAQDEAATADAMSQGVDVFNRMVHGWALKGADVTHTTQTASSTFALGAGYEEPTIYLLAEQLALENSRPLEFNPGPYWATILAAVTVVPEVTMPGALTNMPSQRNRNYSTPEGQ